MSKRTVPDLKELFKQASEIAQQVPDNMQEAAFNRAIDLLTTSKNLDVFDKDASAQQKGVRKGKKPSGFKESDAPVDLIKAIDSTQHPGISTANKALDQSLMVLQIARTDHDIDGLTPGKIAEILTKKFRIGTRANSVSMALNRAPKFVDRVPEGKGYRYRIMRSGEEYLAHLGEEGTMSSSPTNPTSSKKIENDSSKARKRSTNKKTKSKGSGGSPTKKGKVGPKAAVESLIESNFFSKPRKGTEVQQYLNNKRGLMFAADRLRLVMLRLIRDEKLERDTNAEGQYEYKQPKK